MLDKTNSKWIFAPVIVKNKFKWPTALDFEYQGAFLQEMCITWYIFF